MVGRQVLRISSTRLAVVPGIATHTLSCGGRSTLKCTTTYTVIRQNNRGRTMLVCHLNIFNALNTFNDDRQVGDTLPSRQDATL